MPTYTAQTLSTVTGRRAVAAIDTRTPITMWRLLVWAYKHELVRFAGTPPQLYDTWQHVSETGAVMAALQAGVAVRRAIDGDWGRARGTINGRPSAHPDADVVHWVVSRHFTTEEQWALIHAGESGEPPEWNPEVPPLRVVPVRNVRGKPKMLYPADCRRIAAEVGGDAWHGSRNEPVACAIKVIGVNDSERARFLAQARLAYLDWWILLRHLRDRLVVENKLSRWRVTDVGLPMEPWETEAAAIAAE